MAKCYILKAMLPLGRFRSSFDMGDDYFEIVLWLIFFVVLS
jgi:hypothetical protein